MLLLIIKSAKKDMYIIIALLKTICNSAQRAIQTDPKKCKITANIDPYAKNRAKFYLHRYAYIVLFED